MKTIDIESTIKKLIEKNISVATAESCTGGMLGAAITAVPGASAIYGYGFITYANEAKESVLGVSHETLAAYGAVSEQTAREMALGAHEKSGARLCVSVTGIAGPGGGTAEKRWGLYTWAYITAGACVRCGSTFRARGTKFGAKRARRCLSLSQAKSNKKGLTKSV